MRVTKWLCGTGLAATALAGFVGFSSPAMAAEWIGGHYGPGGHWIPGHWIHGDGGPPPEVIVEPEGYRPGRVWISGHYGVHHEWIPGHWRG